MTTVRLRVELREVEPAVVRVIDVPASTTLPELHNLLQAAVGWHDYHLHQFVTADATYGIAVPGEEAWPPDQRDEATARLVDLPERFTYRYDFGDGWTHDIAVLGPGGDRPGCVGGHGACPPEDYGGPSEYAELLAALADPDLDEHEQLTAWVGNRLRPFDETAVDLRIRRTVGQVPARVRLLLDLSAGGLRITPAGRLPRAVVRGIQQRRPHWHLIGRPAATEDDLWPLASLHQLLRRVGLLRLRHGVLTPTKAATDDLSVVRRLRSGFDPDAFTTVVTELTVGVLAAHGPKPYLQLGREVHPLLGHGWSRNGRPITESDVQKTIANQSAIMEALDLIDTRHATWTAGPSARSLLPGATLLADVWSSPSSD
jgi:hypothetical protein